MGEELTSDRSAGTGLRASALAELDQIYASAPIGLVLFDAELRYVRINERLAALNGLPVEEHIGRHVSEIVPDLLEQAEAIRDAFLSGGETITKLFSGTTPAEPGVLRHWVEHWSPMRDGDGELIALNVAVEEVTSQKREQERSDLLALELKHRLKNTLAVVQAIARSTFKDGEAAEARLPTFEGRLEALARAHETLVAADWQHGGVSGLIKSSVDALPPARLELDGLDAKVSADGAMALSLALHELGTNALKHGSLSNDTGLVGIKWVTEGRQLRVTWEESGGPEVAPPKHRGFGTKVLERMLQSDTGAAGHLNYQPSGLVCTIFVALEPQQDIN